MEEIADSRKSAIAPEDAPNIIARKGSYSFTSPEGKVFTTYWTADEYGSQVYGDHLPLAVEAPESLVRTFEDFRRAIAAQIAKV